MTEGSETYKGLAVPLFGESEIVQQSLTNDILTLTGKESSVGNFLTCQLSDGTEVVEIQDDGRVRMKRRGSFSEALNAWYYCTQDDPSATQEYAAAFLLDEEETSISGGRRAVLNVRLNASTAGRHAGMSFINFANEGEVGAALFTILTGAVDGGGVMETNTCATATHGIIIYSNNVKYWIMCSDVSDN